MKKFGFIAFASLFLASCSMLDHTFAPNVQKASIHKPAPYVAPPIFGKRKFGNPYEIMGKTYYPLSTSEGYRRKGVASWYGKDFHGKPTANGETYNMYAMTAAHPTLPIPTYVRVTNIENGLSTIVRVNDRGPFLRGRIIDLSYAAAKTLDMDVQGTAPVLLEALPTDGSVLQVKSRFAKLETNVQNKPEKHYADLPVERANPPIQYKEKKIDKNSFTYRVSRRDVTNPVSSEENLSGAEDVKIGKHQYYIQTGAFSKKQYASRQQLNISKFFPNVKVMSFLRGTTKLHRVRIGPVASVQEADEILGKVAQEGWTNARIVVD